MIRTNIEVNQEMLKIVREITLADPANSRKRIIVKVLAGIMTVVFGIYTIILFGQHSYGEALFGLAWTIFFIWVIIAGARYYQDFALRRMERKQDDKLKSGSREYDFDENGVTVISDVGQGMNNWDAFKCWGIYKEYIYMKRIDGNMLLVNRNSLSKEDDASILALLKDHILN